MVRDGSLTRRRESVNPVTACRLRVAPRRASYSRAARFSRERERRARVSEGCESVGDRKRKRAMRANER